jgi:hypothetical protein
MPAIPWGGIFLKGPYQIRVRLIELEFHRSFGQKVKCIPFLKSEPVVFKAGWWFKKF